MITTPPKAKVRFGTPRFCWVAHGHRRRAAIAHESWRYSVGEEVLW